MANLFRFVTNSLSSWAFTSRVSIVSTKPAQPGLCCGISVESSFHTCFTRLLRLLKSRWNCSIDFMGSWLTVDIRGLLATSSESAVLNVVWRLNTLLSNNLCHIQLDINPFMNGSRIISGLYWLELTALKSQSLAKVFNSFKCLSKVSQGFCFQVERTCWDRLTFFGSTYTDSNVSTASL